MTTRRSAPVSQAAAPTDEDDASPDRWNDQDFTHLEADLPDDSDREVDINIHQGRVAVRRSRQIAGPGMALMSRMIEGSQQTPSADTALRPNDLRMSAA